MPLTIFFHVTNRPANFVKHWPDGMAVPRVGEEVNLQWPDDLARDLLVVREVAWNFGTTDDRQPTVNIMLSNPGPWTRPPRPV